jgi:hypothetical protein
MSGISEARQLPLDHDDWLRGTRSCRSALVPRKAAGIKVIRNHIVGALAVLLVSSGVLAAQEPAPSDTVSAKDRAFLITPFLAPGYTPEQGALVTIGALMSFRTRPFFKEKSTEMVQRSTITLNGSYSTTGALTANVKLSSFWNGDRIRVFVDFAAKDMPDQYWGVGYAAGQAPQSDSTTAYHRLSLSFVPKLLWRVHRAILVGPILDLNGTTASDVSPGMAADPYYQAYGPQNQNHGLGGVFQYDTRDIAANAWKGVYVNAQALYYGGFLGGDNTYEVYDVDYRQYAQLGRPGRTLAWTVRTRVAAGSVPWAELSMLGSGSDLRGYRQGRYRDKAILYGILEYRHQFTSSSRPTGLSRHGLIGWVGAGSLAPTLDQLNDWLPNWGVGYRFEVQPRMSVRMDVGFGREFYESGNTYVPSVYFNFTEAF